MQIRYQTRKLLLLNGILLGVIYLLKYATELPLAIILVWAAISYLWIGKFLSNPRRR